MTDPPPTAENASWTAGGGKDREEEEEDDDGAGSLVSDSASLPARTSTRPFSFFVGGMDRLLGDELVIAGEGPAEEEKAIVAAVLLDTDTGLGIARRLLRSTEDTMAGAPKDGGEQETGSSMEEDRARGAIAAEIEEALEPFFCANHMDSSSWPRPVGARKEERGEDEGGSTSNGPQPGPEASYTWSSLLLGYTPLAWLYPGKVEPGGQQQ